MQIIAIKIRVRVSKLLGIAIPFGEVSSEFDFGRSYLIFAQDVVHLKGFFSYRKFCILHEHVAI